MRLVTSPTARKLLTVLSVSLAAILATPTAAVAADPPAPGSFTGYGFDACVAPNQKVMDAWNLKSPFTAIGIYISGNSRYCGDAYQPNLSNAWVAKNAPTAGDSSRSTSATRHPASRTTPRAGSRRSGCRRQSRRLAARRVATPTRRSPRSRSTASPPAACPTSTSSGTRAPTACDNIVLEFADAWTERLHAEGYKSGLYSSGSAAIKAVDEARIAKRAGFTLPDHMWIAWTNKVANTDGGPYLSDAGWNNHQRIHQY